MSGAGLRAGAPWRVLDGFGGAQRSASLHARPASVDELARVLRAAREERLPVSFRGNGRSYGDASLNSGGLAIDVRGMNRVLSFDRATGVAELEPGATVEDLWRT